jgi:hypothetical protein
LLDGVRLLCGARDEGGTMRESIGVRYLPPRASPDKSGDEPIADRGDGGIVEAGTRKEPVRDDDGGG